MSLIASESGELISLLLALAVGLIIGFERGWNRQSEHRRFPESAPEEDHTVGGIRTFALSGLLGGLVALAAAETHALVLPAGLLIFGAVVAAAYVLQIECLGETGGGRALPTARRSGHGE